MSNIKQINLGGKDNKSLDPMLRQERPRFPSLTILVFPIFCYLVFVIALAAIYIWSAKYVTRSSEAYMIPGSETVTPLAEMRKTKFVKGVERAFTTTS